MLLDIFLSLIFNMTLTARGKHVFIVFGHFFGSFFDLFSPFCYLCSWIHFWASYSIHMTLTAQGKHIFVVFLALFWSFFWPMLLDTFLSLISNMSLIARGKNAFGTFLPLLYIYILLCGTTVFVKKMPILIFSSIKCP